METPRLNSTAINRHLARGAAMRSRAFAHVFDALIDGTAKAARSVTALIL